MAHLFQVGAGSGGIVVLDLLARDPRIDRITLVEPDTYKPHNVYRHLFPADQVSRPKGELAAEWVRARRPELKIDVLPIDLTDPMQQDTLTQVVAACDVGVCAVDTEPAKYHFDQLMRTAGKPWALGEVLSGGIGGWVHRFVPGGACYGCVASHLQRAGPADATPAPPPDYSNPGGPVPETTIPASKASIDVIAGLHALVTLGLVGRGESSNPDGAPAKSDWTSLLVTLAAVPGVFDEAFRTLRMMVPKSPTCLVCSAIRTAAGEELDAALDQALARLRHD